MTQTVDASYRLKARAAGGEVCLCLLYKGHRPEYTQKVNNEKQIIPLKLTCKKQLKQHSVNKHVLPDKTMLKARLQS